MSFSSEQKKEITDHIYKSACCRRSLLSGILFAKGRVDGKTVLMSFDRVEYADYTSHLVHEFYGKESEIFRHSKGGRSITISFSSPSAVKYLSEIDNLGEGYDLCDIITQRCASCLPSFLRGVFLASGRLSDPKKQFSLEFTLCNRAEKYKKILEDLSLTPLISHKKTGDVVYFHKGDEIESFYGHAGLNRVVFDIIETKIKSLARRESQRYLNCVTSNYDRMAAVSERQIGIISRLEETARLKLRYPDLPLSALAAQMTPAISKSGLSHRLKKIEEIGARLLNLSDND